MERDRHPWALHPFQPGRLIIGVMALLLALLFGGDAAGAWHTPWWVAVPVVSSGLCLAGSAASAAYSVRRRRAAISASTESTEAPARISGTHSIR
ncbi:hypothetical protein BB341_10110 [Streptomyces clavuligerus]|nr:hypothetical protein BB341_10110 [Streptomyces clavuligerus]